MWIAFIKPFASSGSILRWPTLYSEAHPEILKLQLVIGQFTNSVLAKKWDACLKESTVSKIINPIDIVPAV